MWKTTLTDWRLDDYIDCQGPTERPSDPEHEIHSKQFLDTIKLLLLGTGESGKTTIIKQMKILHINGYSDSERREKIPFIKNNIHESIYDIISHMNKINPPVEVENKETVRSIEYILGLGQQAPSQFTMEYFDHVKIAWADEGVKKTFERSNEYQLIDSAEHFLNRIDTIKDPDYIPTNQDILFCRIMTVSISKIDFEISVPKKYGGGTAKFWMYDVGGQRGEQRRWITVFAGIQAILFLIAASDFDLKLREDSSKNRLEESFDVFQNINSNLYVKDAAMIVFLNKQDVFQKKMEQGRKLENYFPEYKNFTPPSKEKCNTEYDKAKLFLIQKIEGIARTPIIVENKGLRKGKNIMQELPQRDTYIHCTIATDTNNIRKVFDSVHESILQKIVKDVGLF